MLGSTCKLPLINSLSPRPLYVVHMFCAPFMNINWNLSTASRYMVERVLRFTCKVQLLIALSQHASYLPYAVHVFIVHGTKVYWSLTSASRDIGDPALRSLCKVPLAVGQSQRSRYDV